MTQAGASGAYIDTERGWNIDVISIKVKVDGGSNDSDNSDKESAPPAVPQAGNQNSLADEISRRMQIKKQASRLVRNVIA